MKKMKPEVKKKLYDELEEKTGVLSTPTSVKEFNSLVITGFPSKLFDQWKESCREMYNDTHWLKVWDDHRKAQAYDLLVSSSVQQAEAAPEPEEIDENENIPMIGDGVDENGKRL